MRCLVNVDEKDNLFPANSPDDATVVEGLKWLPFGHFESD